MLNIEYPIIEKKLFNDLELSLKEPKTKINLRGKKKDFFTKAGKILSLILPMNPNTSSTNEKFNALWLSPDEWLIYFDINDKNKVFNDLYNEISKLNYGAITDVSNQWICFNLKGKKIYDLLSSGCPFDFNKFKNLKGAVTQTLLNHIDIIIHNKNINDVNLFVRRSFSNHLWSWMNDSARFI